jgi:hypothetical protein
VTELVDPQPIAAPERVATLVTVPSGVPVTWLVIGNHWRHQNTWQRS